MSMNSVDAIARTPRNAYEVDVIDFDDELDAASGLSIFMADDDAGFVRAYERFFLKIPDLRLLGVANSGRGLVERVDELTPDVLLLDIEMPESNGIEIARRLQQLNLPTKIVMLTAFDHDDYVYRAMNCGAAGFLLKNSSPAQILSAIRSVHAGYSSLAPDVTARLVDHLPRDDEHLAATLDSDALTFTEQQIKICQLLALGYTSQDIAAELHLSNETVRTYLRRMFDKFGVKNRTHLVVAAYRAGVIH